MMKERLHTIEKKVSQSYSHGIMSSIVTKRQKDGEQHYSPLLSPVGGVADLFVLFELVADHFQELVGVGTQVLH